MARSLQGSLGQPYPHRTKQCRDDADVRICCLPDRPVWPRVVMYIIPVPCPPTQIRIVDAPAHCTKEIASNSWTALHLHLHRHLHIPTAPAPTPALQTLFPAGVYILTDATNSVYWKQYDIYISAAACMYYFTFIIFFSFFLSSAFSRADPRCRRAC
jgi:hypothetical protein